MLFLSVCVRYENLEVVFISFWSDLCNAEGYLYSIDIFTAKFSALAYGEFMYKVE
jgi:hypothetical protein